MGVSGRDYIGTSRMDLGVDGEGGDVDRLITLDHLASVVDQNQVRHADVAKVHGEGVHPEVIEAFGIAGGDMTGDSLVESELGEESEGRRQPLLPVEPLLLGGVEHHIRWEFHDLGHDFLLVTDLRCCADWGRSPRPHTKRLAERMLLGRPAWIWLPSALNPKAGGDRRWYQERGH